MTGTRAPIADVSASVKIWLSLFTILIGSVFYCLAEIEGTTVGYIWLGVGHAPNVSNQLPCRCVRPPRPGYCTPPDREPPCADVFRAARVR